MITLVYGLLEIEKVEKGYFTLRIVYLVWDNLCSTNSFFGQETT